jgi:hypothetical protein
MTPPRPKHRQAKRCHSDPADGGGGPDEAAAFIASTLSDLVQIASRHGLGTLGYLLDMAQMEAKDTLLHRRGPDER